MSSREGIVDLPEIRLSQMPPEDGYATGEEFKEYARQMDEALDAMTDADRIETFGCACSWWRDGCRCQRAYVQDGNVIRLVKE